MSTQAGISLYNQSRLSDDNFIANFVARKEVLSALANALRSVLKSGTTEHQIIIGARGMGKSSLLRRIAIEISTDGQLKERLLPLRFREEQYNVISLDAFWRNCGEALAEWCEANGNDTLAATLDTAIASPEWRDAERAAEGFLGHCTALHCRPVLLLDNLDLILNALSAQERWALRRYLQMKDGPVVIGASTQLLSQGADREDAFYEFFNPQFLEPLTEFELLECMRALADARGEAGEPVRKIIATQPERLRTLYTLTGGNPRVLALIYQLMERNESATIFADLEVLLDQVTPFYKARIEDYQTAQQRAVVDAVALNWDPITSHVLAQNTGIEITTISGQLNRLRKDGFIEEVQTSGARAGYQLSERFLNIWYLMRHGTRRAKQKLKWLTIFLTRLFSSDELGRMAELARQDVGNLHWHPYHREAVLEAWDEVCRIKSKEHAVLGFGKISEVLSIVRKLLENGSVTEALSKISIFENHFANESNDFIKIAFDYLKSIVFIANKDYENAIEIINKCIEFTNASDECTLEYINASSIYHKIVILEKLKYKNESNNYLNLLINKFKDNKNDNIKYTLIKAYDIINDKILNKNKKTTLIQNYNYIINNYSNFKDKTIINIALKALNQMTIIEVNLGNYLKSNSYINEAININDNNELNMYFMRMKCIIGSIFEQRNQYEDAITVLNECIKFLEKIPAIEQKNIFAVACSGIGRSLRSLGRHEDAVRSFEKVIIDDQNVEAPEQKEVRSNAFMEKGRIELDIYNDVAAAETSFTQAIETGQDVFMHKANLAWVFIARGAVIESASLRTELEGIAPEGLALIDAGLAVLNDNFGTATDHLQSALEAGLEEGKSVYAEDLLRLLRLIESRGYGERLIAWFESSDNAEKFSPVYVAFLAYVRGERFLLDVNPEVRAPARKLFDDLSAHRRHSASPAPAPEKRKRGRPRKT
ncbi:MAG: AAA family ATPase [Beijerinckiaceae bacterium]